MVSHASLALVPAGAHPCALNYSALPAKVLVIQAGLASGGGWARLTLAVRPPNHDHLRSKLYERL